METSSSLACIQSLVNEIKKQVFSTQSSHHLVAPSPYDTAWLAMIPDPSNPDRPLFQSCLNWVLDNQNEQGFWGDYNGEDGIPTIHALPATLACLVALKKWNVGEHNISKGLACFHAHVDMVLTENAGRLPRWFTVVFPAMIDLAQATGLHLTFLNQPAGTLLSNLFIKRKQMFEREKLVDEWGHYHGDGSFFQSPSATAHLFMTTANAKSLKYLNSLVQNYPNGVAARYPMDEELIKLCVIDHIQRLGLAEHFSQEIAQTLSQIYRNQQKAAELPHDMTSLAEKLHKDSLAFRLLRMQGFHMNPRKLCWFLKHEDIVGHLEENHEYFTCVLYNIYRATDLMFHGEDELEEARSFSRNLLQKSLALRDGDDNLSVSPELLNLIERELSVPWSARMDHLDNRLWIENKFNPLLWIGKDSYYRLSCLQNEKLLQLAEKNFELRQSTYRNELEELKRWSKEKGLVDIGFGREKTMYTYFAVATSTSLPHDSIIRLIAAKAAIVITVADDFFDMEGSLPDLQLLNDAVQRWDGENLRGPSKVIFDALEDLVTEIATRYYIQRGSKITAQLRDIWRETFGSWMRESTWSQTGYRPTMEQYLETGMVSIAADTVLLPAACFLTPSLPTHKMKPAFYEDATKLLMTATRLLNDIQSYQKEKEVGKMNYVLLHLNEHPEGHIEDSIAYVNDMVDKMRKQFLQHVLMTTDDDGDDNYNNMPKSCKLFHLSCFKVFQMFFNSYNLFDSKADLMQEIMKAFYIPFEQDQQPSNNPLIIKVIKPLPVLPPLERSSSSEGAKVSASLGPAATLKHKNKVAISFIRKQVPRNCSLGFYSPKPCTPAKLKSCFI
ncbi:PREDICTED: (E,E)-geranyllinalool synthase isoform X2 [Ipomoea nil]|uniref:(E,E)-geranyllinalool synthase isoform X2 n=1 Tax=Ipomoea nil TaxID=35883 RepID=UPI0009016C9A|nr:PREDICTED: (E,E)-geranyllinalool synthase isoform X2 [Ipomoea nil]